MWQVFVHLEKRVTVLAGSNARMKLDEIESWLKQNVTTQHSVGHLSVAKDEPRVFVEIEPSSVRELEMQGVFISFHERRPGVLVDRATYTYQINEKDSVVAFANATLLAEDLMKARQDWDSVSVEAVWVKE